MASLYEVRPGEWQPVPRPQPLREVIRGALLNALAYTDGDQKAAARLLGVSGRKLDYQLQRHGIPRKKKGGVMTIASHLRPSVLIVGLVSLFLAFGASARAVTVIVNPIAVVFIASSDHNVLAANGTAVLQSYEVRLMDGVAPFGTVRYVENIGKPIPNDVGRITSLFSTALLTTMTTNVVYTLRVVALGPGGQSESLDSDPFVLLGCPVDASLTRSHSGCVPRAAAWPPRRWAHHRAAVLMTAWPQLMKRPAASASWSWVFWDV